MRRKDSVQILKNNIASYHRMVELKKKKKDKPRDKNGRLLSKYSKKAKIDMLRRIQA